MSRVWRLFGWPRATRGTLLGWLLAGNVGLALVDWLAFGRFDLVIQLGWHVELSAPWWRAALGLTVDLALVAVAVARLHDVGRSGWWLAVVPVLALLASLVAVELGLVVLVAWLALLLWPGEIGPNRFGPDPRGWESRAHYERQRAELARR